MEVKTSKVKIQMRAKTIKVKLQTQMEVKIIKVHLLKIKVKTIKSQFLFQMETFKVQWILPLQQMAQVLQHQTEISIIHHLLEIAVSSAYIYLWLIEMLL